MSDLLPVLAENVDAEQSNLRARSNPTNISLRGVRVHNLKNVDVELPRGKLIAVCGVSGSGKTSFALDTLYAEGQRRYIESFSAYTRQFLERLEKPDFDSIEGLPPALAVTRGSAPRGNRSTVGTASETLDYLRLIFANASRLNCYQCDAAIDSHTPHTVALLIAGLPKQNKIMLAFRARWEDVGERASILADLQNEGFVRLLAGDRILNLGQDQRDALSESLPKSGSALVIVDRLRGGDGPDRTTESLETAFDHGYDEVQLLVDASADELAQSAPPFTKATPITVDDAPWTSTEFSRRLRCVNCEIDYPDPEPRLFSFNSPLGACPRCEGFGDTIDLDMKLIVPDQDKSIREGAIAPWNSPAYEHNLDMLLDVAAEAKIPVDVPFKKLTKRQTKLVMEGAPSAGYEGVEGFFKWLERKKYKMHVRVFISRWRSYNRCTACNGARLNPTALAFKVGGKNIAEICDLEIDTLSAFLRELQLDERESTISDVPLSQVLNRLRYLHAVGLGYLQLNRTLRTLSGGEAQRTALTAALGSTLVNLLYVLDEPTAGLHPHDVDNLTTAIVELKTRGNTVVIVEHEEALIRQADEILEFGPGAGSQGGEVAFQGPAEPTTKGKSLTLDYLFGNRFVPIPESRRTSKKSITISGCTGNNLRGIDVEFPLNLLCVVTGVSGSGKSSLVQDTLYAALTNRLTKKTVDCLPFKKITGTGQIDECILVDQSPVSRSPRSNPVTYVKAFDEIRSAFANTTEARTRNMSAGHFSFNSDLGRCPQCSGDGVLQIDMQFLADVNMTCPTCNGSRYKSEILTVRFRDRSIADVLKMTVREASVFFRGNAKVQQKLKVLLDVGLDYLQLGQSATTLSSGEAQRLKLAGYLAAASRKRTLFLLDEPTTGLHSHDIVRLLACFDALLENGHSLCVVEHNCHLMAAADHIIDLGPGPAEQGGSIVAEGTPEQIAKCKQSITAPYLRRTLDSR